MSAIKIHAPLYWNHKQAGQKGENSVSDKLLAFTHGQVKNEIPMFRNLVIVQCVLFLPLLALLMFGFHAQLSLLIVTTALFLINIVIDMGGSGMRTVNSIFALGILDILLLLLLVVSLS